MPRCFSSPAVLALVFLSLGCCSCFDSVLARKTRAEVEAAAFAAVASAEPSPSSLGELYPRFAQERAQYAPLESMPEEEDLFRQIEEEAERLAHPRPVPLEGPEPEDCMEVPFAVCVGDDEAGGRSVLAGNAAHKALVGHWNFEDCEGQDQSGWLNNIERVPAPALVAKHGLGPECTTVAAPGYLGQGYSAHFTGEHVFKIPHRPSYNSKELTISFWLFLTEAPFSIYRTLMHKGDEKYANPSLSLEPETRKLRVAVNVDLERQEAVLSLASIPVRRWTFVTYVQDGRILQIWINGILDRELVLSQRPLLNEEPLYLVRTPWSERGMSANCLMDEVSIYDAALSADEINNLGSDAFPGLGSKFARLGCQQCHLEDALSSCRKYYHLCTKEELYAGALTIGRTMGWVDMNEPVWDLHATEPITDDGSTKLGTGLCCRN